MPVAAKLHRKKKRPVVHSERFARLLYTEVLILLAAYPYMRLLWQYLGVPFETRVFTKNTGWCTVRSITGSVCPKKYELLTKAWLHI